jgi:hypothetical protein
VAFFKRNSLPLNLVPSVIAALNSSWVENITNPIPLPTKVLGSLTRRTFYILPNFAKWERTSSSDTTKGRFPTKTVVLKSSWDFYFLTSSVDSYWGLTVSTRICFSIKSDWLSVRAFGTDSLLLNNT